MYSRTRGVHESHSLKSNHRFEKTPSTASTTFDEAEQENATIDQYRIIAEKFFGWAANSFSFCQGKRSECKSLMIMASNPMITLVRAVRARTVPLLNAREMSKFHSFVP